MMQSAAMRALFRLGPYWFLKETAKRMVNQGVASLYRNIGGVRYQERKIHDYRLLLDLDDRGICRQLMIKGDREQEHAYILRNVIKPGMAVFDVGANIGYYSTMMAKLVGPEGKVYAVEPSISNYHLLNVNINLNRLQRVVETFNLGISKETGIEKLYMSEMSNCHTFCPDEWSDNPMQALKIEPPVEVPVMSIGDFTQGKRNIDFVRMDIEGYEVEVLEGLIPNLEDDAFRANILVETHPETYDDGNHNMRDVLGKLFERGYSVKWLVADSYYGRRSHGVYLKKGYSDEHLVATFRMCDRAIYQNISREDTLDFVCDTDLVRGVLLERKA